MPNNQPDRPRHDWFPWLVVGLFSTSAIVSLINYADLQRWKQYKMHNSCIITGYGIKTDGGITHRIQVEHVGSIHQWNVLTEYTCSKNGQIVWR